MGNPAQELVGYLRRWSRNSNSGMYAVRDGENPGDLTFWKEQARVVRLVCEVHAILQAREDSGKNVDHYAVALIGAYRAAFAPDLQWSNGNEVVTIDERDINVIASLADYLEDVGFVSAKVPVEAQASIADVLDELMALVADGELPVDAWTRAYISRLVMHLRELVSDADTYGDVDLLRYIYELIGVLLTFANVAEQHDQPAGPVAKLRELAARLVPFTGPAAFTLGLVADTDAVAKMITGG